MKLNRNKLIQLMNDRKLKCRDVAEMLDVKEQTVRMWRCKIRDDIPSGKLELLQFKIKQLKL